MPPNNGDLLCLAAGRIGNSNEPEEQTEDTDNDEQGKDDVTQCFTHMETQYGYDGGYCGENDIKEDEVYALGGVEPAELGTGCADDGDEHKDSEVAEDREDLVLLNILLLSVTSLTFWKVSTTLLTVGFRSASSASAAQRGQMPFSSSSVPHTVQ